MNTYEFDDQGNLKHFINEELRATVPESSISVYRESWPDAPGATADVVAERDEVQS